MRIAAMSANAKDEALGAPTASSEPRECSFDDPAAGWHLDALGVVRSLFDPGRPFANAGNCRSPRFAGGPSGSVRVIQNGRKVL
jgi:hypothetical protein